MGQKIDWASLEAVSLYLEVQNIDLLIDSLILFKGFHDQHQQAQWQTQQQA